MKNKIYQVDAFAVREFSGNPAAVCPLEEWLDDALLQNIAMENNLAETAFYVKQGDRYQIRWFTPKAEVDLCGHATLAAAFVLFNYEDHKEETVRFYSPRSGELSVTNRGGVLALDFPADVFEEVPLTEELRSGFNFTPVRVLKGKTDFMLVFENQSLIEHIVPDLARIAKVGGRGVIVTAKGDEADFVSRFFAPQIGVDEDPVTGSAHTTLAPFWAGVLGKTELSAIQLSGRKGYLKCKTKGDRVEICGQCRLYMTGEIYFGND